MIWIIKGFAVRHYIENRVKGVNVVNRDIRSRIKFRVWYQGRFHHWGFLEDDFVHPPCVAGDDADEIGRKSQQYTGIKDRNGKEIYVGDIIDVSSFGFRNKRFYIITSVFAFGEDIGVAGDLWSRSDCAVLGNIYEDRELLSQALAIRR